MPTSTPDKTPSVDVLAHQAATHPTTIVGSAIDARTLRAAILHLYHGYVEAAADTNPGKFKVQVRPDAGNGSVNEHWITVAEFTAKGTTPDDETLSGSESVGATVLEVASTTGFAVEDQLYIQDTSVVADGEWAELRTLVTNTSITIIDGLTNAKDNADKIFNDASKFICGLDLNGIESYRVLWVHEGATGANGHVKVIGSHYDSDSSA